MKEITIDGTKYRLNVEMALEDGSLHELKFPLKVGDVYKDPTGNSCNLLLAGSTYGIDGDEYGLYQLLGMGAGCNSNTFFCKTHTISEIEGFLDREGFKFLKNINADISRLVEE